MRLTVITPSFNQAGFIEKTLKSVLDQGWDDLEYFVIDGGSTDGSVEIIERYADRLAWWVSEPDAGQTDALNKGVRRATGNVVAYINSDDRYLPGSFQIAMSTLAETDASWVAGAALFEDADGSPYQTWWPELPRHGRAQWVLGPWGVPQAATFWRREIFERHGLFREDLHYVFDTEFGLRLAFAGELPALIDKELAVRVLHKEAKSWDPEHFRREERIILALYRPLMTPAERRSLLAARAARAVIHRTPRTLSRRLVTQPPFAEPGAERPRRPSAD
jgi:glycosyltransferase involved in cell wall biosynthesis